MVAISAKAMRVVEGSVCLGNLTRASRGQIEDITDFLISLGHTSDNKNNIAFIKY